MPSTITTSGCGRWNCRNNSVDHDGVAAHAANRKNGTYRVFSVDTDGDEYRWKCGKATQVAAQATVLAHRRTVIEFDGYFKMPVSGTIWFKANSMRSLA